MWSKRFAMTSHSEITLKGPPCHSCPDCIITTTFTKLRWWKVKRFEKRQKRRGWGKIKHDVLKNEYWLRSFISLLMILVCFLWNQFNYWGSFMRIVFFHSSTCLWCKIIYNKMMMNTHWWGPTGIIVWVPDEIYNSQSCNSLSPQSNIITTLLLLSLDGKLMLRRNTRRFYFGMQESHTDVLCFFN